jgi:HKD family nuclease
MNLVHGGRTLDLKLRALIESHSNISFAVAWASPGSAAFSAICAARHKIRKAVIGTHFYQTHPDVLDEFIGFDKCRFIMQPQGVFHPKAFLFWSNSAWDLLIGSANLTRGALTKNTELLLHVSSKDTNNVLKTEAKGAIAEFWGQGQAISKKDADAYRGLWEAQQAALKRISGTYGGTGETKAPIQTQIMTMSWSEFLNLVKEDPTHKAEDRCNLLELANKCFRSHRSLSKMELGMRKTIAGLPTDWNEHWGWFGSMSGAGYYHQAINTNNSHISKALDLIPSDGAVTYEIYRRYIDRFVQAFPNGRHGVGIASRLLALKRPDQFVCLNSKNRVALCADFGIKLSGLDYTRYWDDVICRIMDSVWWNSPRPKQAMEARFWNGRAALLDALFYNPGA